MAYVCKCRKEFKTYAVIKVHYPQANLKAIENPERHRFEHDNHNTRPSREEVERRSVLHIKLLNKIKTF